jgi:hypothetical protein
MDSRPKFPARAFLTWPAVVADLGGTAWLCISNSPWVLKVCVCGVEFLGFYTILVFYLGRRREWTRGGERPGGSTSSAD